MRKILPIFIFALIGILLITWLPVNAKNTKVYQSNELEQSSLLLELVDANVTLGVNETFDPNQYIVAAQYDTIHLPIINTSKVGSQLAIYKIEKNLESITKVLKVQILDDEKPFFESKVETLSTDYGTSLDFSQYFSGHDHQSEVTLTYEGDYDVNKAGDYSLVAILTDASGNQEKHHFTLTVKEEVKPVEVQVDSTPVTTSTTTATSTSSDSNSEDTFSVRLTQYGMDCYGCSNYGGVGYTSTGIALKANAVKQPDGTWLEGLTYNGRYIFGSSSSHQRCTLVTVYNHGYSGMGISPNEPIYGVIADVGAVGYNHLDLFIGSENVTSPVSIVDWSTQPYAIITGYGTFTGSGCSF